VHLDPYARLAELAEAERDHALAGRVDAVLAVQEERAALVAGLPERAPREARSQLERAAAAQTEATAALAAAVRAARTDAVRVDRGRTAVSAYRPAGAPARRVARVG